MTMRTAAQTEVKGYVSAGFECVRNAFAENFSLRNELGAACCVYKNGEKVVDLWGGIRSKNTMSPWQADTMVPVFSATKGMAAMVFALAHSRGWLDYEQRVSHYWPEFAQHGKESTTVRHLLSHQAGLFAFNEPVDRAMVADLDRLAEVLARQKPAWNPGVRQAYHALTLGFYQGELLRRIDPQRRTLGKFFDEEIASPLGHEMYIRLPETVTKEQLGKVEDVGVLPTLWAYPIRLTLATMNPWSNIHRALFVNPGFRISHDDKLMYMRNFEVPSGGGICTARALARAYGVFASGGQELQIRPETIDELSAPATPPECGFYDMCLMSKDVQFSLGFMKSSSEWPFGSDASFGAPGAGGAFGFADPKNGVGYAYVTSQMGPGVYADPRELALRNAVYSVIS